MSADALTSPRAIADGCVSCKLSEAGTLPDEGTLLVAEWNRSMASTWSIAEDDLRFAEQIVGWLSGLETEKAKVR